MSAPIDDGGPAFPQGSPEMCMEGQSVGETQGMSIRDYAEIHFIAALIASPRAPFGCGSAVAAEDYIRLGRVTATLWLAARKENV